MKSFVILLVALTMLVKPLWPVGEYIMNYDYIVNVLCENKERPELQCDGKCYLAKQLAKESEQQDENPFGEKQSKTEIQPLVFYQSNLNFEFGANFFQNAQSNFKVPTQFIPTLFTSECSQPPELV